MSRYAGKTGLVYLSTSGTGAATSIAQLTNWTLDMTTDKLDTTCFGDTNKTYVQSWKDIKGTFKGLWNDASDDIFTASDSSRRLRKCTSTRQARPSRSTSTGRPGWTCRCPERCQRARGDQR